MRILSICTDGISNKLVCGFQYSTRTEETIKAKKREVYGCKQSYIHIQYVRGDCSVYETAELRAKLRNYDQCVTFCGTGSHHQNGIAEEYTKTIVDKSRTVLLNAHTIWPSSIDMELWVFVFRHVVLQLNNSPIFDLAYRTSYG